MWAAVALSLLAVAYNNAVNRWSPFHSWAYVPTNLLFVASLTAAATVGLELSPGELGVRGDVGDLALPLGIVVAFAIIVLAIARSRHAERIADKRVAGLRGRALTWYVAVRVPVGTALTEELVFRGILLAAWREAGATDLVAALGSSAAFGLWHVTPTMVGLNLNDPQASVPTVRVVVIGAVLLTLAAGLCLTGLRLGTGGLVAPILLHAGINSAGAIGAVVAARNTLSCLVPFEVGSRK